MLELAQVTEVIFNGQSLLTRPAKGLTQPPVRDPYPRLHRRDRTHVGGEIRHIHPLCLIEQVERAVQVSLSLPYASHRLTPPSPVRRESGAFAQLLTCQQVLRRRLQIVTFTLQFTQSDVQVSRSPQHRLALLRCELQCLLVGAHRLVETTLPNPDISQEPSAADNVGDVPGPLHTLHASRIGPVC